MMACVNALVRVHKTDMAVFLLCILSFRSGAGDRVWSPTISENGKTSPYMEPDSQVTAVYSGFSVAQGFCNVGIYAHWDTVTTGVLVFRFWFKPG